MTPLKLISWNIREGGRRSSPCDCGAHSGPETGLGRAAGNGQPQCRGAHIELQMV
jgi:hypothetical protein